MSYGTAVRQRVWRSFKRAPSRPLRMRGARLPLVPFELSQFSQSLLHTLQGPLGHKDLVLLLHDPQDKVFRVQAKRGYGERDLTRVQFAESSPLVRHFTAHSMPVHYSQLQRTPWIKTLPPQEREALDQLGEGLLVPISAARRLVALLVLGKKIFGSTQEGQYRGTLPADDRTHIGMLIEEALLYQKAKKSHDQSASSQGQPAEMGQLARPESTIQGIAHDLNNVLTTILSHAQLLEDEPESNSVRPHSVAIYQAALDAAESVRRMQGSAGYAAEPRSRTVDVNEIIKGTLQMIEPRWRQGRISSLPASGVGSLPQLLPDKQAAGGNMREPYRDLVLTLRPAGCIYISPAEFRRVLTNIISNALDALLSDGRIEIASGQDGPWAVISVMDNGTGISPEMRERIFEPYFTTKSQLGTGLGLSISHSIITRCGGNLAVESEEGRGSTFTIRLPLADPEWGNVP